MKLIVGLGNPGKQYELTRHNVGFICLDFAKDKYNLTFKMDPSFNAMVATTLIGGEKCIFVKPQTYMNLSGDAIGKIMKYYKVDINDLLVIYDDMDIPLGSLRLREKGSAGGHNGIKSIIKLLGSESFKRIRVGVGKDPNIDIINYVLGKPRKEDLPKIEEALTKAMKASIDFVNTPFDKVMSMYNTKG